MDDIAQFRVMNPHQKPLLNRHRKQDYSAVISRIYTRNRNQRQIPKRGQGIQNIAQKYVSKRKCFEHFEYLY